MAGEDTSQPPPPTITSTKAPPPPQMVSSVKLPILKKGEYILWTMMMEQYLAYINYALWEAILNGNSVVQMTKDKASNEVKVPPITAQQKLARTRERKAKSTLLMAIPDEHLARFYGIKDAKTLWATIKTRFGGNAESKKMQKNVLKQQFEIFFASNSEGLDKGYDRFERLLSLLEIHGACVSTKDANQKFLRSLPSAWSNISLIMRNKPGINNLDIDDLKHQQLDNEDLEQIDQDDLEEIDLKWQVAMLSMRSKRLYKKTGRKLEFNGKEQVGFDKTKVECFNYHRRGHLARDCRSARNSWNISRDAGNTGHRGIDNGKRPVKEEDENVLVVQDGLGNYDWSYQVEEEATDFALMAFTSNPSSSSSSTSELQSCSKQCYDSQFNEKEVLDINKKEVTKTVFDNHSSDEKNSLANDRFKKVFTRSGRILVSAAKPKAAASTSASKPVNTSGPKQSVKFSRSRIFTRSGRILVSAAKPKAAASTSASKPVNTSRPKQSVKFSRSRSTFHKLHSPITRSFYNATTHSKRNSTERVNNVGSKVVSAVKRSEVTAIKTSAGCVWRPRVNEIDQISKDNRWICTHVDYVDPQGQLNSGKKAYLADYQGINDGGFVAFGSSRGKITSKASTSIETQKLLEKDEEAADVDVHLHRSMIGSLMYLMASRPDIMFATIVATSTTEAEYVAAANYRG
nr:ribonuclease H-like domain-containing protein [Tanacetum cinerariifolium]